MSRTAFFLIPFLVAASAVGSPAAEQGAVPSIEAGVPHPTRDKPQSRLWYARGRWWAWLPAVEGSAVWRRGPDGWQREAHLDMWLRAVPGHADVVAEGDRASAVLLAPGALRFVALRFDPEKDAYEPRLAREIALRPSAPAAKPIESATLAATADGCFWTAYDRERRIRVRASFDGGRSWTGEITLSGELHQDDIGAITGIEGGAGVLWSDQLRHGMYFRRHAAGDAADAWAPEETVIEGPGLADDHINIALAPDGTLFVASKNSIDTVGEPQLCLYVRRPGGSWEAHPYAPRSASWEPSRPVALIAPDAGRLLLVHTVYDRRQPRSRPDAIAFLDTDIEHLSLAAPWTILLEADASLNDPTGPKAPLPSGAPWIILASDASGRVYEAELPRRTRL